MTIKLVKITQGRLRLQPKFLPDWPEKGEVCLFPLEFVMDVKTCPDSRMQSWGAYCLNKNSAWQDKINSLTAEADEGVVNLNLLVSSIFHSTFNRVGEYIHMGIPKELFHLEWLPKDGEVLTHYIQEGPTIWTQSAYKHHMSVAEPYKFDY